ncbi:hypothetical protein [Pseudoroseomonas ludipueritiae]|uniref:Uncharacterized protein n=1 Tax=Pseudoroseomonas ludipueritiae TaxID=198093 RepID=A0ABR7R7J8_9PROT|nr:hypothetical protein [Pseudoroseomonas ludipueritiae]MBC9177745.1 hypothetical protein [Pseudoroseomonas ludipueritiae]MCG7360575.1 hypothetical protein [Roseomonas sp. ACRSG]
MRLLAILTLCAGLCSGLGQTAAQESSRTLVLDTSPSKRSFEAIVAAWTSRADRLSPAVLRRRITELYEFDARDAVTLSGRLRSASVACNFPGAGQCRTAVESSLVDLKVAQSPYRRVTATEATFLYGDWLRSLNDVYVPIAGVIRIPYLVYNRPGPVPGERAPGSFTRLGLALVPTSEVQNGDTAFNAILDLVRSGEIFQCRRAQGVCHQLWTLKSADQGQTDSDLYAVCKLAWSGTVTGEIPFDCVPIASREGDGRRVLGILEYLEPYEQGGTDLVGAISFEKSLSERDLREIISAAAAAIEMPPPSGEMSARRLFTKSPAARAPGSSVWTKRELLITYRKSLGEEEWYVDLHMSTAFGLFQGSSHLRYGEEEEDRREAERFLQKMRQICQARQVETRCRVIT